MTSAIDEEAVVEQLYCGSREDFLPTRTERVRQARAAGDRALAARIGALRKPTVGAWLVNQVVHRYPDRLAELTELAERLRSVHQHGDGERIRAAGRERQALLRSLDGVVREVAAAADLRLGADAVNQVTTTFQAALVDPAALRAVRSGRLAATVAQDSDLMGLLPAMDTPAPVWPSRSSPPAAAPSPSPAPLDEPEDVAGVDPVAAPPPEPEPVPEPPKPSRELIEAGRREDECAAARDRAEQELAAAQEHATRTRELADEAHARFNLARQEHDAALEAIASARTALTAADREVRAAHQAVVALRDTSG
jgi:hypothetical protein